LLTHALRTILSATDGLAGSSAAARRKSSSSSGNNSTTAGNGGITSLDAAAIVTAALKRSANSSVSSSGSSGRDRVVDPSKISDSSDTSSAVLPLNMYQFAAADAPRPTDPICAVAANASTLIVALESGSVFRFSLPLLTLEGRYTVACVPATLSLNCDGSLCGIIDRGGMLTVLPLLTHDDDHTTSNSTSKSNKKHQHHASTGSSSGGYINGRARVSAADWSTFERKVYSLYVQNSSLRSLYVHECTVLHYFTSWCTLLL
jgi:hypothetical protein